VIAALAGLGAAVLAAGLHAGIVRWLPKRLYLAAVAGCFVAACAAVATVTAGIAAPSWSQWILAGCLAGSLVAAYGLLFIGIAWDSPTLALLNFILDRGTEGMPTAELEDFIRSHPFVRSRIDALVQTGVLAETGDGFTARSKLGFLVQVSDTYRRLCGEQIAAG